MKYKAIAVAAAVGLLLSGCGGSATESSSSASPSSITTSEAPKIMPHLTGRPFSEAAATLGAALIDYEAVGTDGELFTGGTGDASKIVGTEPIANGEIGPGEKVTVKVDNTQNAVDAAAAVKAAAVKRAARYSFQCSASETAITAKDNESFNSVPKIWAAANFPQFRSCDLRVDGAWYLDKYTLEPDEAAVVQQMGADGGDISRPSSAYGSVLLLCALPPKEGWDTKYGEYPSGGPKVRAEAKAAAAMCPDAPHAAELIRVAGGVPPAPKTSVGDGTFIAGRDIAEGTYQIVVPAGANGVHDCYWERTDPQGATIDNDFISFAPQGPAVSIYAGEGFVSKRCGSWVKIG